MSRPPLRPGRPADHPTHVPSQNRGSSDSLVKRDAVSRHSSYGVFACHLFGRYDNLYADQRQREISKSRWLSPGIFRSGAGAADDRHLDLRVLVFHTKAILADVVPVCSPTGTIVDIIHSSRTPRKPRHSSPSDTMVGGGLAWIRSLCGQGGTGLTRRTAIRDSGACSALHTAYPSQTKD